MKTSQLLDQGSIYSRKDLQSMFGITDATIRTGVYKPPMHDSIWLFVTEDKPPDRTQYKDKLKGNILEWDGQTSGRTDDWIIHHVRDGKELLLFYRKSKRQFSNYGFVYEGPFEYASHSGSRPTHFILRRAGSILDEVEQDLASMVAEEERFEGRRKARYTNYYERNARLRADAVRTHGTTCKACGFDFEDFYGARGKDYIEVHHLRPVSELGGRTTVNPAKDMTVVCANCHRMIHRRRDHVLTINELGELIAKS